MFSTRPIPHYNLGERLQKEREKLGLTPEEFSRKTKIPARHIENLEKNNFLSLPPDVYVRGFLGSCAEVLNIDKNEILEQYRRERRVILKRDVSVNRDKSLKRSNFNITPAVLKWAVFIFAVLAAGGYFWYQVGFLLRPPDIFIDYPAENIVVSEPVIAVGGNAQRYYELYFNGSPLFTDENGKFSENVSLLPGLNTLEFKGINRFGKEKVILRQVIYESGNN